MISTIIRDMVVNWSHLYFIDIQSVSLESAIIIIIRTIIIIRLLYLILVAYRTNEII